MHELQTKSAEFTSAKLPKIFMYILLIQCHIFPLDLITRIVHKFLLNLPCEIKIWYHMLSSISWQTGYHIAGNWHALELIEKEGSLAETHD